MGGTSGGTGELRERGEIEEGVAKAAREPELYMFEDSGGVCTRVVSSTGEIALATTSSLSTRMGNTIGRNKGGRTTGVIKRVVTGETVRGKVARIMFSENKCLCRNEIRILTRTTERTKLGFWLAGRAGRKGTRIASWTSEYGAA